MNIAYEDARRLYPEAHAFYSGEQRYLSGTSEIRQLALTTFGRDYVSQLTFVCCEIFRVLAEKHWEETKCL